MSKSAPIEKSYKLFDLVEYSGRKISASSQPGYEFPSRTESDQEILRKLEEIEGELSTDRIAATIVDKELIDDLKFLHDSGVRVIYSLASAEKDRDPELLKYLWEKYFNNAEDPTTYITNIEGTNIEIKDYTAPSMDQLSKISEDVDQRTKRGEHIHIHCGYGAGRTGSLVTAINMKILGQNLDEAEKSMQRNYPNGRIERYEQRSALKDFSISLGHDEESKEMTDDRITNELYPYIGLEPMEAIILGGVPFKSTEEFIQVKIDLINSIPHQKLTLRDKDGNTILHAIANKGEKKREEKLVKELLSLVKYEDLFIQNSKESSFFSIVEVERNNNYLKCIVNQFSTNKEFQNDIDTKNKILDISIEKEDIELIKDLLPNINSEDLILKLNKIETSTREIKELIINKLLADETLKDNKEAQLNIFNLARNTGNKELIQKSIKNISNEDLILHLSDVEKSTKETKELVINKLLADETLKTNKEVQLNILSLAIDIGSTELVKEIVKNLSNDDLISKADLLTKGGDEIMTTLIEKLETEDLLKSDPASGKQILSIFIKKLLDILEPNSFSEELIKKIPDGQVFEKTSNGLSFLLYSIGGLNSYISDILIEKMTPAELGLTDIGKQTALYILAQAVEMFMETEESSVKTASNLVEKMNAEDLSIQAEHNKETALHKICQWDVEEGEIEKGVKDLVEKMVRKNPDLLFLQDRKGKTALDYAKEKRGEESEIVKFLETEEAKVRTSTLAAASTGRSDDLSRGEVREQETAPTKIETPTREERHTQVPKHLEGLSLEDSNAIKLAGTALLGRKSSVEKSPATKDDISIFKSSKGRGR
jgi:ankyrin repeat protein